MATIQNGKNRKWVQDCSSNFMRTSCRNEKRKNVYKNKIITFGNSHNEQVNF